MKILYASNICSDKEFEKIYNLCNENKPLQSIQKFNKLLCEGMQENKNIELEVITSVPINRKMCKKTIWIGKKEKEKEITYSYCFMLNIPIIKFITLFLSSVYIAIKWCIKNRKEKQKVVIYDAYCPIIANVSAIVGKLFKSKIIALYTDVPKCMSDNLENKNIIKKILKNIYNEIDKLSNKISNGYILLTEQMNEVVNLKNKPYIVIEGLADNKIDVANTIDNKYKEFTILYAGGLYKKFGIEVLVKAVEKIQNDNIKLLLYGNGEMTEELQNSKSKKIQYGGVLPNKEIVKQEVKSTILVNPRFSNEEYTKYSFPSKNMEYMASGTPVLTTKLSGMPEEYNNYVYFIEKETVEGIKDSIENLMQKDRKELHNKGIRAKEFVLENKNNIKQANKIFEFIKLL